MIGKQQKISDIMSFVKGQDPYSERGIPISLWIKAEIDPCNEEWAAVCKDMVNWYKAYFGRKDRNSCFAQYLTRMNIK